MSKKKKILLLSDDLRMHSGIATQSKEFVMGTIHKYDWCQLGGAVKHPEEGKIIASVCDFIVAFIPEGVEANGTKSVLEYAKKLDKKRIIIS